MDWKPLRLPAPVRAAVAALVSTVLCLAAGAPAAVAGEDAATQQARDAVAQLRARFDPAAAPAEETRRTLSWKGRPALEITARPAGAGSPNPPRDQAVYDVGTGRVVSFTWFPNASTRKAGEAIIALSEASSRADAHARSLFPGIELALEGIDRYRASGEESVYYLASFIAPAAEIPFLQAPVRLLLDASTGNLFRVEADPEWFAPPRMPAAHLNRKAAERVAAAALRVGNLAAAFGPGAALGKVGAAETFVVRPNDWLAAPAAAAPAEARVAWVVPFSLAGGSSAAVHRVFVDAATGRLLGGIPGLAAAPR